MEHFRELAVSSKPQTKTFSRANINLHSPANHSDIIKTVPELIEYNAKHNPEHVFCVQARKQTESLRPESITVTHLSLKHAVLHCSTWMTENLSELKLPSRESCGKVVKGRPVALLMDSDIGLLIYELALISLGVPVLLLSARLSPTATHHLVAKTSAHVILASPRLQSTAKEAVSFFTAEEELPDIVAPILYDSFLVLSGNTNQGERSICGLDHYINETDRSVLILHTSGTTGLPKPVYTSHKQVLSFTVCHDFRNEEEVQGLNLSTLPLYHGFGLVAPCLSMGAGKAFCLPAPNIPPTGTSVVELLESMNSRSLMSVPSILEEIVLMAGGKGIQALSALQFVAFGGGLLKSSVGEILSAAGVKLLNHYGTTESGPLAPIFVPKDGYDWRYFRLRKDMNLSLDPVSTLEDGVQTYKLTTRPFGWETTFEVQDQLVANPRLPLTDFNAVGRDDNLIVLATGEKVLPRILESLLSESELVKAAVAFGNGHLELGIIVEPTTPTPTSQSEELKARLWPIVIEANKYMDGHAEIISKDAMIIVPPWMTIPRTDKGSIARMEAYKLFEGEIAKAYRNLEDNMVDDSLPPFSMATIEDDLKVTIQNVSNWRIPAEQWGYEDDFFDLGMNSLQSIQLRRALLISMSTLMDGLPQAQWIGRDFVYQHPSITRMATAIRSIVAPDGVATYQQVQINDFVELYSVKDGSPRQGPRGGVVVLLTGSTGSLGCHLLAHIIMLPTVARVVCLNRPIQGSSLQSDPKAQVQQSAEAKGVVISQESWSRIEVFRTNTAAPLLGLKHSEYTDLCRRVTHILHNAWPMDFMRKLLSFQGQFQALQNLLNLARDAHNACPMVRPRFLFLSSIAVVGQYSHNHGKRIIPEVAMVDEKSTNPMGYSEAKLVCEKIIETAVQDYGNEMEATFVRIGQMSGSSKSGFWNTSEHIAGLIKSSQTIGKLPLLEGTFSWIPVDSAAEVLSEILLAKSPVNLVYHLENPVRQSWHDALVILALKLNISSDGLIPFDEWLEEVCKAKESTPEENPANKLADFFEKDFQRMSNGEVILGTEGAREISPALQLLDVVSCETIAAYVDHWRKVGFLS